MAEYKSYVICTSPRSGSTMLCKLLAATKVAGNPGSLFHTPSIGSWLEYYGLRPDAYGSKEQALEAIFGAAKAKGRGDSDVFGLRLQRGSFDFFMEQLDLLHPNETSDLDRVEAAFGPTLFIFLTRDDRLDQAISYLRAEQTGLWHRHADGTALEQLEPKRSDGYEYKAIKDLVDEFTRVNDAWRRWFEVQAITPLEVSYERLSKEPKAVLGEILNGLGLDGSISHGIPQQTAKLSDKTNKDWRIRFEAQAALPT
ncbi:Stf0 family sulfotransferase [Phaeobacter sp. C3_T13_0]|uniref:Stf0 family sulfotransferase n=1 Tax=Phaeobacter cretensis TaxID=3342641 RepID=UPI0039BD3846